MRIPAVVAARVRRRPRRATAGETSPSTLVRAGLEVEESSTVGDGLTGPLVVGRVLEVDRADRVQEADPVLPRRRRRGTATRHRRARDHLRREQLRRRRPRRRRPAGGGAARRVRDRRPRDVRPRLRRHDLLRARAGPRRRPRRDPGAAARHGRARRAAPRAPRHRRAGHRRHGTPDRGYCLSLRGIARELATAYGLPLRDPAPGGRRAARPSGATPAQCVVDDLDGAALYTLSTITGFDPRAATPRGCGPSERSPGSARCRSPSTSPTTSWSSWASRCTRSTSAS